MRRLFAAPHGAARCTTVVTHALWWCQNISERIAHRGGAGRADRISDKQAAGIVDRVLNVVYVDNFATLFTLYFIEFVMFNSPINIFSM